MIENTKTISLNRVRRGSLTVIKLSIRKKIMGIAVTLIALMVVTAVWTVVLVMQVGERIEELTYSYVPAYGDLARANIRSLEQGITIRRIIIDRLQSPEGSGQQTALRNRYDSLGGQVELEILAARALIHGLIAKGPALGEVSTLSQFESRIDAINEETSRRLDAEIKRLLAALDSGDSKALADEMERVDELRDELNRKLDSVRADMLALLRRDANTTVNKQQQVMLISIALTVLAAILGLVFAALVSTGVTRPVRRLLEGLVKVMNRYFSTMSAPIRRHQGVIDKYIGDAIMAYWGPPFAADAEQTRLASLAALEMLQLVPQLRAELPELLGVRTLPNAFDIRIGIATGEVLVGSIGSELMMSYTVMGDTVNLASRLEGANKEYGGRILVSAATIAGASDAIEAREIDRLVTLGQTRPQAVFEIMGGKGELTAAQLELRARYAEGLAAYRAQRWDEARRSFEAALLAMPGDGPSMAFIARIDRLAAAPPGEGWDGAWHLERK